MSAQTITTRKATQEDTEEVQRIWAASFANDSHTLFKAHEKGIGPVQELPLDLIPSWIDIKPEDGVFLVGTDAAGSILGWASWCFYNLTGAKPVDDSPRVPVDAPVEYKEDGKTKLDKLRNITSGHMFAMYDRLCTPPNKVIFAQAIAVDPKAQGKGVGKALIKAATDIADQHGASMWVHLSDSQAGVSAFQSNGFVKRSEVTVELDEYKTKSHPENGSDWGAYTFRLLVRDAKTS